MMNKYKILAIVWIRLRLYQPELFTYSPTIYVLPAVLITSSDERGR